MATAPKNAPKNSRKKQNFSLAWSMLFFVLAIIGFLGMMHPLDLEPFDTFNNIMKYMLGRWHILLPFIFLIISGRVLLGIRLVRLNTSFVSFIIFSICGPALFHHIRIPMQEELIPENLTHGGGLWGGTIALILHKVVGQYATFAILAIGCITAIAILIPWGQILSSKKRAEEYEAFLKETEQIGAQQTQKDEEHPRRNRTSFLAKERPVVTTTTATAPKQNVYREDEFASFTEGIKPQNKFTKVLNFGSNKNTTYEQEDIKEQIEKDPVQIPEWEEEKKPSVVIRPAINYGGGSKAANKNITIAEVDAEAEETASETTTIKPYESIIHNPYHNVGEESEAAKEEAITPAATATVKAEQPTEIKAEASKNHSGFVIHRPQELNVESKETPVNPDDISPTLDGFVEAADAINAAALKEQEAASVNATSNTTAKTATKAAQQKPKETAPAAAEAKPSATEMTELPPILQTEEKAEPKQAYIFPPYELLAPPAKQNSAAGDAEIMQQCSVLEQTLADFKVRAKVVAATRGPAVTQFELQPAPGVKVNTVVNLADDIALRLAAPGVRMEAPIPGKSAIGIEVPNLKTDPVNFREVVDTDIVRNKASKLCIGLGKDISGNIITADIAKMPHLLIAGSTGSGKSVCINTIICGILYKALPEEVKLILVDPKVVELSIYDGIPHLLTPVVTDPKKAASALHWAVAEMERRYKLFADNHVRNIDGFNKEAQEKMPYIVIIIDEMADLMACVKADIETAVMRLAAKARAAGIHMILATQRPSVDVITGVLKNNIPSRIAFAVTSLIDSRTILDSAGAEKLLGKGDMLYSPSGSNKPTRVQGAFVSDEEVGSIVEFIIGQSIPVEYSDEVTSVELESDKKNNSAAADEDTEAPGPTEDPLFEKALMLVLDTGQASASMMQRRFSIGYNRAARLVDTMAELGVVGKAMGSKPREVIMSRQEAEERFLNKE